MVRLNDESLHAAASDALHEADPMSYTELRDARLRSVQDWFKWYFHWRKFWLDNFAHALIGFVVVAPIAWVMTEAVPMWAAFCAALLGAIPREWDQWPPPRMPILGRAWFDTFIDLAFFGLGGVLCSIAF